MKACSQNRLIASRVTRLSEGPGEAGVLAMKAKMKSELARLGKALFD